MRIKNCDRTRWLIVFVNIVAFSVAINAKEVVEKEALCAIIKNPEFYYVNNSGCKSLYVLEEMITFEEPIIIDYKYDYRFYIFNRGDVDLSKITQKKLLANPNVYILLWDWPEALAVNVPSDMLFDIYNISGEHSFLERQYDSKKYAIYNYQKAPLYYQLLLIKGSYLNVLSSPPHIDWASREAVRDIRYFESLDSTAYYKCLMPVWREDKQSESFEEFFVKFSKDYQFQLERTDTTHADFMLNRYEFIECPSNIKNGSESILNDGRCVFMNYKVAGNRTYMKIYDYSDDSFKNYSEYWFRLIDGKWYLYFYYDRIGLQKQ